jgi:NAD+ synthetase
MCAYVYASAGLGESTTDLVFSAHSLICEDGVIMKESSLFKNESGFVEVDLQKLTMERTRNNCFVQKDSEYKTVYFDFAPDDAHLSYKISQSPFVPSVDDELTHRCEKILTMQAAALKKRLEHIGSDSLVLGISGGLDSCLALLVCARTMDMLNLPRKNVLAVTMPCFGTTERTRKNAFDLCGELGVSFKEISIFDSVLKHFEDIGHDRDDHSVVYENAQARERMQVLMDLANKMNGIVVGTGDLSEMALGWATFNGDHISMYSVNGDIPKTLVRYLVRHEAERSGEGLKNTLYSILDTPVSPELLPAENGKISQKTEEIVGPYELHDFFIYYCLRFGFSPAKIYLLAKNAFDGVYDDETILKWLKSFYKRVFAQQYKRSTMPDGPKIGSVSLSPRGDLRLPSDAVSRLWLDEANSLN